MTRRPNAHPKGRMGQGFSLIEILVATVVLAFGVLGMAQLFLVAIYKNDEAAIHTESSNMLAHRLEQYRQMDYCKLEEEADASWVPEERLDGEFENMGQNTDDPKVFAGRSDKAVGLNATDWVIERRILDSRLLGDTIDKNDVKDIVLIELRGYKRGTDTKRKWIYMSTYRTNRGTTCPPSP